MTANGTPTMTPWQFPISPSKLQQFMPQPPLSPNLTPYEPHLRGSKIISWAGQYHQPQILKCVQDPERNLGLGPSQIHQDHAAQCQEGCCDSLELEWDHGKSGIIIVVLCLASQTPLNVACQAALTLYFPITILAVYLILLC